MYLCNSKFGYFATMIKLKKHAKITRKHLATFFQIFKNRNIGKLIKPNYSFTNMKEKISFSCMLFFRETAHKQ